MTDIVLYHEHYDREHLEQVKSEMLELGAPAIRAIWSECWGLWLAVEGCHRLRAAHELEITPIIQDISDDETAVIQIDGLDEEISVADLAAEVHNYAPRSESLSFAGLERR